MKKRMTRFMTVLCTAFIAFSVFISTFIPAVASTDFSALGLVHQSLEVFPNGEETEELITLEGMMPQGAEAVATDVTDVSNGILAYDISIKDGEDDFVPVEGKPIKVEINDARITSGMDILLRHIADDGTIELIEDFELSDGKITFSAEGFSVYEVVPAEEVKLHGDTAATVDELDGKGFYLSVAKNASTAYYFLNTLIEGFKIKKSGANNKDAAAIWYFEKQDNGQFKIYTMIDGVKTYMSMSIGSNRGNMSLTTDANAASPFDVELFNNTNGSFYISVNEYGLNMFNGASGNGFAGWKDKTDTGSSIVLTYGPEEPPDDALGLNGKTYSLFNHKNGRSTAAALTANESSQYPGRLEAYSLEIRNNPIHEGQLFFSEDDEVTSWTFHSISEQDYYITTNKDGKTYYLKIQGEDTDNAAILLSETADEDCVLTVALGTGSYKGKIRISNKDNISPNLFNSRLDYGFGGWNDSGVNEWFSLAQPSNFDETEFIINMAQEVSVSDTEKVKNGSKVIVYTRVWNEQTLSYDYMIVDSNGNLVSAFEIGDNIEWYGMKINSLLWDFTEYYYEGTNTPNNYYELYNPYSGKYFAPQINGNQVLSDAAIGINLNGRRYGDYYTKIMAWDDTYYQYAGLKIDKQTGKVVSCPVSQADDFYFAIIEESEDELTTIETLDNHDYGITMKMVDFGKNIKDSRSEDQTEVMGEGEYLYGDPNKNLLTAWINGEYPTATLTNKSLGELFGSATEVNHLFSEAIHKESGYFEYDCTNNFASLDSETGNFKVYDQVGTIEGTHKLLNHGQFMPYNDLTPGLLSQKFKNLYDPEGRDLPVDDPRRSQPLYQIPSAEADYYFGMQLEAGFSQTVSGTDAWGNDMIFEFTGDDDFYLYIDDVLVIDLGGIHDALSGTVNFRTGDVKASGSEDTTLRAIFERTFRERYLTENGTEPSAAEVSEYLSQYFSGDEVMFKDYSAHKMKVFYMERGATASDLHIRFNLMSVKPGQVLLSKNVSGSEETDFQLAEYPFQIYYKTKTDDRFVRLTPSSSATDSVGVFYPSSDRTAKYAEHFTPNGSETVYDDVFFLNAGESVYISFPDDTIEYYIVECGINPEVYDTVKCNDEVLAGTPEASSSRLSFSNGVGTVADRPVAAFDNHVREDAMRSLSMIKKLYDSSGNELHDDTSTFSFRLYLDNENSEYSVLEYANMQPYYVKDPNGNYCRWDAAAGTFATTGTADLSLLNMEEITFHTSPNGAISKIPAWYTVEVPNIPVGAKFRVTERDSEIPLGYSLMGYERIDGTYYSEQGEAANVGIVRANESPKMGINNKKGIGIKAEKVWSDKDYVSEHAPVYLAVYRGNVPVGAVKQLSHPNTSVSWYFDDASDHLAEYSVREVVVTNPVIAADGTVTGYDALAPLAHGDTVNIQTTLQTGAVKNAEYTVRYAEGDPTDEGNARTDVVHNERNNGILLRLGEWNGTDANRDIVKLLADGKFNLVLTVTDEDGNITKTVDYGTFVTGEDGVITQIFGYTPGEHNVYTITQTAAPSGYIGMEGPLQFYIDEAGTVHFINRSTTDGWANHLPGSGKIDAFINIYNKPFSLSALKLDAETDLPLAGAGFALYRGVLVGGEYRKDYFPLSGYDVTKLISGSNGVIPKIDNTLAPGRYYLAEEKVPDGYEKLGSDIVFDISENGEVTLVSAPSGVELGMTESGDTVATKALTLSISNSKKQINYVELSVTKLVEGASNDEDREYNFTFTVSGASTSDTFEWRKGAQVQIPIASGGTFTLQNGQTAVFIVPENTNVTIREEEGEYHTTFQVGAGEAENCTGKTVLMMDDIEVTVTNTFDSIIPTGIFGTSFIWYLLLALPALAAMLLVIWKHRGKR